MHHDQIMESYTPLNNYLSNCVIKLHIKLHDHSFIFMSHPFDYLDKNKMPPHLVPRPFLFNPLLISELKISRWW
jgi:hypothetical protein